MDRRPESVKRDPHARQLDTSGAVDGDIPTSDQAMDDQRLEALGKLLHRQAACLERLMTGLERARDAL